MNKSLKSNSENHNETSVFELWRAYLNSTLIAFHRWQVQTSYFGARLFLFFIFINIAFYWVAMVTAFPGLIFGASRNEYFLIQFPVGFLGGLFDSLSLFITLYMARRALKFSSNFTYLLHLSADILIAVCATFWVLFVFTFSGWLIGFWIQQPESLITRSLVYEERFISALKNPTDKDELRNIYFGIMMGCSAIIPTLVHVSLFLKAVQTQLKP